METTKEQMSEYLKRLQVLQQRLFGIADVTIDTSVSQSWCRLDISIYPLDNGARLRYTSTGIVSHRASIWSYDSKEENAEKMKSIAEIVEKLEGEAK